MAYDGADSTSTPLSFRRQWDVFLSFRGEDTRDGITTSLYRSLDGQGVRVFLDDVGLNRGDEIAPGLLEAIEDSAAFIVILSKDYASSHWCLEELARICELRRRSLIRRLVLPVFYEVDPSHVRKQIGPFEEAFFSHEKRFGKDKAKEWREAMAKVGSLAGFVVKNKSEGGEVIRVLLREVLKHVNNTPVEVASYPVGLDARVTELINLLDVKSHGIKVVGLHGMGGIGKTTLAKAVFNKVLGLEQFEHRSFISNVRELSKQEDGLVSLQNKLVGDLFGSTADIDLSANEVDVNASKIRKNIHGKRILIVLDDVDDENQLNAVGAGVKWRNEGNIRVIVTTRNKGVLNERYVNGIYEVRELHFDQALQLFSYHALRKDQPTKEFLKLSKEIVSLTGNLPLALEVFGSFLFGKRKVTEWEDALSKLRDIRPHKVQDVLKISFDALDAENQCIFLDVACLFTSLETKRDDIVDVLKGCDFKAEIGLKDLEEKSLIKFHEDDTIWMHDQLRDMGRQIVQNESFLDPGMRSRLWDRDEIITVLKNYKGTRRIQGIVMNMKKADNGRKQVTVGTEPFESMVSLRLLQVNNVNLEGKFKFLPRELKWLQWQGCALDTLPSDFCPQKLAVIDLSGSKIKQLWSSSVNEVAENLKILNLRDCAHLASLPDLSGHRKLEKIVLKNCVALVNIHKSVGSLKSLHHLDMTRCLKLVEFPSDVSGMKNLQTLVLSYCSGLEELPEGIGSMKALKELYVDHTGIDKLPESIYRLEKLEKLILDGCIRIKRLPTCLGMLVSLKELRLNHSAIERLPDSVGSLENLEQLSLISCESLNAIPDTVGNLKLLKELFIKGSAITELPNSIGTLSYLKSLFVEGKEISKLPDSFRGLSSAVELDIEGTSITCLPSHIGDLTLLEKIGIRSCISLESLPESTGSLFALTYMNIYNTGITELPESFGMLENLITLRLNKCRKLHKLPSSMGNLKSLHHLYMKETDVKELPESFGMLTSLQVLKIGEKRSMQVQPNSPSVVLPSSFTNLSSLQELDAWAWRICGEIPDDFEKLSNLEVLFLGNNDFHKLPSSLSGLSLLKDLQLPNCEKLESLPPLPSSLESLNLANCISLERFSDLSNLECLKDLNLTNCEKLVDIPGLESLKSLTTLYMSNCSTCASATKERLSKVYLKNLKNLSMPGSRIPDWFSQDTVTFSSHKSLDLTGVILMVVVSVNHHVPDELRYQIPAVVDVQAQIFDGDRKIFTTTLDLIGVPKTNQDHVHLCRYQAHRPLVSFLKDGFKIKVTTQNPPFVKGIELKKAGIYLVYENDDDYDGNEESLDESLQTVSERLAKFFSSLEENGVVRQNDCSMY
ncbi:TMV resistance protein N-like isoform X2 [Hibiscus syriacus]|uniref:TMV resistance protein N-like isoform X2 n=1 Tax=Hibiscus syriacus TaxID=106335 RepID=A0A6A3BM72_HIBSY|nr:disease resistance protein RPV1-like [Hibiscus syriacus]KAE8716508.1 TMV resistance protein N-like isoform X2 [Hibiscus syriacus]